MSQIQSMFWRATLVVGLLAAFTPLVSAQQGGADLTAISLESLMNTQVTSVSRHQEELRKTAAAIYVITQEDIRQSGMTDIADLLRMVPGVQVAQINNRVSAVGARGFNAEYSTKLLVLVDGRTVYDPMFSGVFWHLQNLVLQDIERIEVIRGPGATMWGANAVNGVISITTRRAVDTQGGLLVADSGSGRPGEGSFRFGGTLGNAFYRTSIRQTTRSSSSTPTGAPGGDAWNLTTSSFRVDWNASKSDSLTFDGDAYRGVMGSRSSALISLSPVTFENADLWNNKGGHALARWTHSFDDSSSLTVQGYYDVTRREAYDNTLVKSIDLDLQYRFKIGHKNDVMVGFGRRDYLDHFFNSLSVGITPARGDIGVTSAFVQDEITLADKKVYLTIGTKILHNTLSGYDAQPALSLSWLPTLRQSLWASVSRAVRTPSPAERGAYANLSAFDAGTLPGIVSVLGSPTAESENLIAYQAGYRYQANRKLWFDMTSFFNAYSHLSTIEPGVTFLADQPVPHLVMPMYFGNAMNGETYGAEIAANYKVTSRFSLKGSYSDLRLTLHGYNGTRTSENAEGQSPQHQWHLGASINLPRSFEVSGNAYFAGALSNYQVPAYTRLDANLGWKGLEHLEFNIVGQNLLGSHTEFGNSATPADKISSSIFGRITWRF
jgi:iron complex outermembrane receptor protein